MPDILSLIHVRKPDSMTNRILQRHRHTVSLRAGVFIEGRAPSEIEEVPVEKRIAEPMSFLAQRDLLPTELDRDEVERLDLLGTRLLRRARFGRPAALHPALDDRLLLPRDEHRRNVRHALVLHLAHRDTVDRDAHQSRLPHLPCERAQRRGVLRGGDGELGEHGGDGGIVAEEVGEEALAVARAYVRGSAGAGEGESVVDGRYIRQGVPDVNHDA